MLARKWKGKAGNLTSGDVAVLDQLLACSPGYEMVDDYTAVNRLLDRGFIEPSVRIEGSADPPVYRITPTGAEAYGRMSGYIPVEKVG